MSTNPSPPRLSSGHRHPRTRRSNVGSSARLFAPLLLTLITVAACDRPETAVSDSADASGSTIPDELAPQRLWELWPEARFVDVDPPSYRHADLVADLARLRQRHPNLEITVEGTSFEGRAIHRLRLGNGPLSVLAWSQMHGDEPSATPALLDLADWLLSEPDTPWAQQILSQMTLDLVPMLNPDGAERYTRRNAQNIDINRDALNLATPEGRLLQQIRDRWNHELGFNLHDQGRRKEVGRTGTPAVAAVLAVAGDEPKTVTPGRERAMRVCAGIVEALAPFYPGGVSRYDDTFNERAFGDNVTAWGTPVVLLESGGLPPGEPVENLARLNFTALLHVLREVAVDDAQRWAEESYIELPFNASTSWVDVLVRGSNVQQAPDTEPYRADLAFQVERTERAPEVDLTEWLRPEVRQARSWLVEFGDARHLQGSRELDATGRTLIPALEFELVGWRAARDLGANGGAALDRLARHGVGRIHWTVPERRLEAARERIGQWRRNGRPLIELTTGSRAARALPAMSEVPVAPTLGALLRASGAERPTLDGLPHRRHALRPGEPASFLIVTGERPDENSVVESIWIDGIEVSEVSEASEASEASEGD